DRTGPDRLRIGGRGFRVGLQSREGQPGGQCDRTRERERQGEPGLRLRIPRRQDLADGPESPAAAEPTEAVRPLEASRKKLQEQHERKRKGDQTLDGEPAKDAAEESGYGQDAQDPPCRPNLPDSPL